MKKQRTLQDFFNKGKKADNDDKKEIIKENNQSNKKRNMVIDSDEEQFQFTSNSKKTDKIQQEQPTTQTQENTQQLEISKMEITDDKSNQIEQEKEIETTPVKNISPKIQEEMQNGVENNTASQQQQKQEEEEQEQEEEKVTEISQKKIPSMFTPKNSSQKKSTTNPEIKSQPNSKSKQIENAIVNNKNQVKSQDINNNNNNNNNNNIERKPYKDLKQPCDQDYNIVKDAPFYENQDVPFFFISETFESIQDIKGKDSKLTKITILSKMFRSIIELNPKQLIPTYYFCILRIAPDYELNELGIGKELINKALQKATGKSAKQLRDSLQELGDYGLVAQKSRQNQKTIHTFMVKKQEKPPLTMQHIYDQMVKIAYTKGNQSGAIKEALIVKMLIDSSPVDNKFIMRYIEDNLRIQAAEKTMQEGLAKAFFDKAYFGTKTNINYSEEHAQKFEHFNNCIKRALCEYPNYTEVIEILLKIGKDIDKLNEICKVKPGVPCKPMLAKPTKSIQVILKRFENQKFTCEYKYDGLRGQIHYKNKEVTIFSRNLENMTETYPDIVQLVKQQIGDTLEDFILDSEIVAFDTRTNKIRSFQELATRARKNVSLSEVNIAVCIFMFDLIYINGKSLLQLPLAERRQHIQDNFKVIEGKFQMATHLDSDDIEQIEAFLTESIKVGCEGLMIKTLKDDGSSYEPAKRSFKWLKLKKDYLDSGLGDSFDLVPIGAIFGGGKRKGVYGSYLLACYNEDMECYETICKAGSGFSDEQLDAFHKYFQDKIINHPLQEYKIKDFKADVWFQPSMVWEIKGADLQISPVYTCAVGRIDETRGIGLRFPRLLRIREDKDPEDATTNNQIYEIYKQQSVLDNFDDDDDFY